MFAKATSALSFSKGTGFDKWCILLTHKKHTRKLFVFKSKFKTLALYCYCLADNTWAWLFTEFIPIQDTEWPGYRAERCG